MADTLCAIEDQTQKAILKQSLLEKAIVLYYDILDDIKLRDRASQEPIESDILEFINEHNKKIYRKFQISLFNTENDMQEFLKHVLLQIADKPAVRETDNQFVFSELMELVNGSTNSRNGKPEITPGNIKISLEHLKNDSTDLFEPIPKYLLNAKFKSYATETPSIFGFLSRSFSSEPVSIFQMLINNEESPYYKKELAQSIYKNPGTILYKEYPQLGEFEAFSDRSNDPDYTFYNGTISNSRLRGSLADFLKAQNTHQSTENNQAHPIPYIFIGFIKLSPTRFGRIIKSITGVDGHMGCFMINAKTKQIIHFEPKGAFVKISPWQNLDLKEEFIDLLETFPGTLDDLSLNTDLVKQLDTYQLVRTTELKSTPSTPQYFDIYCQTYSMYAALFYCLNTINLGDTKIDANFFDSLNQKKAILFQNFFFDFLAPRIKLERKSIEVVKRLRQNVTNSRSSIALINANKQLNSNTRKGRFELLKKELEKLEMEISMHTVALAKLETDYDLKYTEREKIKKDRSPKLKVLKTLLKQYEESREFYNNKSSARLDISLLRKEVDRLTYELKRNADVLNTLYHGKARYIFSRNDGNNKKKIIDKLIDIGIYELKNWLLNLWDEYDQKMAIYSLYEQVPIFSSDTVSRLGFFKKKPTKFTFQNLGLTEPIRDLLQNSRAAGAQQESDAAFANALRTAINTNFARTGLYGNDEANSNHGPTSSNNSSGSPSSNSSSGSPSSSGSNSSSVLSGSPSSIGSNSSSVLSGSPSSNNSVLVVGGSRKKYKSNKNKCKKYKSNKNKCKKSKKSKKSKKIRNNK